MIVHPVSLEIAQLAGRIEGEQAAKGIAIVATLNVRHFQLIPSLKIVTL